jgi:hypothetical protein
MSPNERADIWQERYIAAILEIDGEKISLRVRAAKMAICDRVEELNGGGSASERAALNQAMKALGELQEIYPGKSKTKLLSKATHLRDVA